MLICFPIQIVKKTHESGGFGSIGYGCVFKREEVLKNLLRTHTTAISAQMLYRLGQEFVQTGVFTPKKYFSIDRLVSSGGYILILDQLRVKTLVNLSCFCQLFTC